MKTKYLLLAIGMAMGLGVGGIGCAHHDPTFQSANEMEYKQGERQYLTGSYIPQDVRHTGQITDGRSNVRVLGRSDLDRSGAATPGEAFERLGVSP